MVFSSPIFLFAFLPVVLLGALGLPRRAQNAFLALLSLLFYFWGEVGWGFILLASIAFNYGAGLLIEQFSPRAPLLALAVVPNLALLGWFKYGAFLADNLNAALGLAGPSRLSVGKIHLPIGISFFTFHALSYVIDIHRGRSRPQRSPLDFALYITFFPQLIAGPIVRYHDIATQLSTHRVSAPALAAGIRRFVLGLGKKVLIANTVATVVDELFALPPAELTPAVAWLSAALYALQIYFDFSAYSDMAIGLAKMFGLTFLENFDYPYVARSVTEFWRRWHISLSRWFRDYVYVPLGGNRRGRVRTYVNLVTVFLLCGLWHGASWTFVVWGLFHGAFLVLERALLSRLLERLPRVVGHAYLLLVVLVGWVFFRADSLGRAWLHLSAMAGVSPGGQSLAAALQYPHRDLVLAAGVGVVGSTPLGPWLGAKRERLRSEARGMSAALYVAWEVVAVSTTALVFVASVAMLASGTYNPFIYFRF